MTKTNYPRALFATLLLLLLSVKGYADTHEWVAAAQDVPQIGVVDLL